MGNIAALPFIPISAPAFGAEEEEAVLEVLRSGHLAQGPKVAEFEALCAEMAGSRHAVAVANGTLALQASLAACGVGPGDEVITSPFTFNATLNAIIKSGATARFADITDDFTIDPGSMEALINERTKVVMPVHLYGLMADMTAISQLARRKGLAIIEDAAQAHGASCAGHAAGSFGLGCFSFYATKNVTSAEGGMVTTSDDAVAEQLRIMRNQGMRARYEYVAIGENWRLTDLAAALAIPQMRRLNEINEKRDRNAQLLSDLLADIPALELPKVPAGRTHVWHRYTVLLPADAGRTDVMQQLAGAGVGSDICYPRLTWDNAPYLRHPQVIVAETPRASDAVKRCLSLPIRPELGESDVHRIADAMRSTLTA